MRPRRFARKIPCAGNFLLGPAGSGKTYRCLAEIRDALRKNPEGPPLILLAPKQATFQLERQLLADPSAAGINGYTRLRTFSFERLAKFVFDNLHVALPQLLAEEGRVMVLRALLMQHERELKLFHRSARRTGFSRQLASCSANCNTTTCRLKNSARLPPA